MRSFFYARFAMSSLGKNRQTYVPYILTCVGAIAMFYNIYALCRHPQSGNGTLAALLLMPGAIICAFFFIVFLLYTNSFLIKRRKRELGLYNILGMEKRHIGKIMLWESFFVGVGSLASGLGAGILLSKLLTLILFKLMHFDPKYDFQISYEAIILTLVLFAGIFAVTLLVNLSQVHFSNPIELLRGASVGEREPKTKWVTAVIGVITLAAGYVWALTVSNVMQIIFAFFFAAILVIIGTYCIFTAGSIAVLKLLRKNKNYYYKTSHFTTVSGMIYRMRQNAAGLASICILSTAVLVTLSTTVSMFIGIEDSLARRYSTDFRVPTNYSEGDAAHLPKIEKIVLNTLESQGIEALDYRQYSYFSFPCVRSDNNFTLDGTNLAQNSSSAIIIMTAENYERSQGKNVELLENQVLVYSNGARLSNSFTIFDKEYQILKELDSFKLDTDMVAWAVDLYCVVVKNEDALTSIRDAYNLAIGNDTTPYMNTIVFNSAGTDEEKIAFNDTLNNALSESPLTAFSINRQEHKSGFYELYGGLLFLGIFLGFIFLMATVLIIYYKQVVEGYDDNSRYRIMKKVGMSKAEIKSSIQSQVLTVFALPLVAAVVHIVVAFPVLTKLLGMLNLDNVNLFIYCIIGTVVVFAAIYALVYTVTAKVYYKIVNT